MVVCICVYIGVGVIYTHIVQKFILKSFFFCLLDGICCMHAVWIGIGGGNLALKNRSKIILLLPPSGRCILCIYCLDGGGNFHIQVKFILLLLPLGGGGKETSITNLPTSSRSLSRRRRGRRPRPAKIAHRGEGGWPQVGKKDSQL